LFSGACSIAIATHVSPDGDAVGSMLGLGLSLEAFGKQVGMACEDQIPRRLRYLPASERISNRLPDSYDMLVALDVSDEGRLGSLLNREQLGARPLVVIDHHVTNSGFGVLNWIDSTYAATAHMVLELIRRLGLPLDAASATCLLNGLVTDTRGFSTSSTSEATLAAAIDLMHAGAPLSEVTARGLLGRPFDAVKVWGAVLSASEMLDGIAWAAVSEEQMDRSEGDTGGLDGLSNFLLNADGVRVAVLFKSRSKGRVEVSFRSVPGVDVGSVALRLGGGGHKQASGCLLTGAVDEIRERVLTETRHHLESGGAG
jgi:bifunctional oligoribonuclease and PAP phosphatase NrnA